MRMGRRKLLGVAAGVLVTGIAIGAWFVGGSDLLLGVVLATVLLGVGGVGYMIVQGERRTRAHVGATVNQLLDALVMDLDGKLQGPGEQFEALLRAINARHVRLETQLMASIEAAIEEDSRLRVEEIRQALEKLQVVIGERQETSDQQMIRQFGHTPADLDALMQVHRRLMLDDPLPLMGGWAMSPRGMLQAIELVADPTVSVVVECGSGTSTLFLARVLQLKGTGKLVALEHLPEFADKTRAALEHHGLDGIAEVRYAPLEKVNLDDSSYMWYSLASIADIESADVIVVDGPPQSTGTWARYPAFPLLRHLLSDSGVILIDDMGRRDERSMVDAWVEMGQLAETSALGPEQAILRPYRGD